MMRPELLERTRYEPNVPVEDFMVPLLRRRLDEILEALPYASPGFKVLDVGCGGQPFRRAIEEKRLSYVSVDAQDPRGIVDVVAEIDGELPRALFELGPFDFIMCTEVLEHVADWDAAFRNLSALLRDGGRLVVTCPHFYILHEEPYDFWRPTIHALRASGIRHGLQAVSLEALGSAWDVLGTLLGANYKGARAVRPSLTNRVLARVIDVCTGLLHRMLKKGWLQARVSWENKSYPVYLSNVAVFSKSSASD